MIHTEPVIGELSREEYERLDTYRREHLDDPLGSVADEVLIEDDNVRIWQLTLEPGQSSALHRRDHDYYLCIMSGDRIVGMELPGSEADMYVCEIPPQGNTVFVPAGTTEWAVNVGTQPYREILIELKR